MYPIRVAGYSHQKYWWDRAGGRPIYYQEEFDFVFTFTSGDEAEFIGKADGRLVMAKPLDRAKSSGRNPEADRHSSHPRRHGAAERAGGDDHPRKRELSAELRHLMPAEQEKLRHIADVLTKYPDRDIAIAGHTAEQPATLRRTTRSSPCSGRRQRRISSSPSGRDRQST